MQYVWAITKALFKKETYSFKCINPKVLNQGWFSPTREKIGHIFLLSQLQTVELEECTIDIKWLEAKAAAKYPKMHTGQPPTTKKYLTQISAEAEKPCINQKKDQKEMLKTNKLSIQKVGGRKQQIEMHKKERKQ